MQHEQTLEIAGAARKIETREVVAGHRAHAHHQHHLRQRDEQRIAEGGPDAGIAASGSGLALELIGDVGDPQEAEIVGVEIGTGDEGEGDQGHGREGELEAPPPPFVFEGDAQDQRGHECGHQDGERQPQHGRAGPGAAGERDGEQPQIWHDDRQRAEDQHGVEEDCHSTAAHPCASHEAWPVLGRRSRDLARELHQPTSIRGFCNSARMSKKRQRIMATEIPTTTRPSASAAP